MPMLDIQRTKLQPIWPSYTNTNTNSTMNHAKEAINNNRLLTALSAFYCLSDYNFPLEFPIVAFPTVLHNT